MPDRVNADAHQANSAVPIFMGHGIHDPVVPVQLGRQSYDFLRSQGYDVEWHTYSMQHSVNMDEIRDISTWMTTLL